MKKILSALFFSFLTTAAFAQSSSPLQVTAENSIDALSLQPNTVNQYSYNFGSMPLNSMRSVVWTVTNTGSVPLHFSQAYTTGMFDAYHNCAPGLNPGQQCRVDIRFWPYMEGFHSGRFVLSFGSQDIHLIIDLWGHAYRY